MVGFINYLPLGRRPIATHLLTTTLSGRRLQTGVALSRRVRQSSQGIIPLQKGLRKHFVTMRVATDGDAVVVHYTGYLDDGTKFDSSVERGEPLNFIVGGGDVIRGFDDAVRGLSPGESRRSRIEPNRAYGDRSEEMVFTVARNAYPSGLPLDVGSRVPLTNGMAASIVEITDDKIKLDANHQLAGKPLTFDMELVGFAETELGPVENGKERAIFGLGCFWGAELAYQRVPGVISTKVGYTQGKTGKPTYKQVCSGSTGHAEAVAVDFDPSVVSYKDLVDLFWERLGKSALTLNQVGNDVGTQYRSGIYYTTEEQKKVAEESKKNAKDQFGKDTVVEIVNGEDIPFYLAESYHQRYLEKGGQNAEKGATETIRCYG